MLQNDRVIKWCCCVCGTLWDESQTYNDPKSTVKVHTCGNLYCRGKCYKILTERKVYK